MEHSILDLNRDIVLNDYQKEDAAIICNKFYETSIGVISIVILILITLIIISITILITLIVISYI